MSILCSVFHKISILFIPIPLLKHGMERETFIEKIFSQKDLEGHIGLNYIFDDVKCFSHQTDLWEFL